mmetsp:Transcript_32067/g.41094  ORF Transcript_32067/g.41094 Transcript_32067/m.41094 type:complete len:551 (-) Transcript_32067:253-1905(-)
MLTIGINLNNRKVLVTQNMDRAKVNGIILSLENDMNQSLLSLKATASQQMIDLKNIVKKYADLDAQKTNISTENGREDSKLDDMIELNVSGRLMRFRRKVYLSIPGSLLAGIFSGRWDKSFPKDSKGRFFLNENPSCFRYVLNTLAGFSSNVVVDDSLLQSIIERYRLGNGWNQGEKIKEYQNINFGQTEIAQNFARYSNSTNPLERNFVELLDNYNSQKLMLQNLNNQYELDALQFEKEVALMKETIEDGKVVLELNVRGEYVTTTQATLQVVPDSMLAAKFDSSKWSLQENTDLDDKGNVLIDVDPAVFHNVLDYLRSRKLCQEGLFSLHKYVVNQPEILERTLNYLFPGNTEMGKIFATNGATVESRLLSLEHQCIVRNWCAESVSLPNARLSLIYRASRDGWSQNDFLSKCNDNAKTLLVVSANGGIFGGFSNVCWIGPRGHVRSGVSFLFSLVAPSISTGSREPTKISITSGKEANAIYLGNSILFGFGGGSDLSISQNANANTASYSNLGHTYALPQGYSGAHDCYFAGSRNFAPTEIECFVFE